MKKVCLALALAGGLITSSSFGASFASSVVNYSHGVGFATEFSPPNIGYTNPVVALGQPNPNTQFGAVTPFNPPFSRTEIVSLGVGGSLTVGFSSPILNNPGNPFGLDFIIYGSAGFIDMDYPNGLTDGTASMFGQNTGNTRVSVSSDGITFYTLNPALAPVVDGLFPSDGAGIFGVPVNPAFGPGDLANRTGTQLQGLYGGSAGGTGYDLAWALDINNQPVSLPSILQIRVDVLSGRAEIDGFAAVLVPEPTTLALAMTGGVLVWLRRRVSRSGK